MGLLPSVKGPLRRHAVPPLTSVARYSAAIERPARAAELTDSSPSFPSVCFVVAVRAAAGSR